MVDYKTLFISTPCTVLILDPTFKIVEVTNEYLNMVSRTRESMLGMSIFEAFPNNPEKPHSGVDILRESLERVLKHKKTDVIDVIRYDIPINGVFVERWWEPSNEPILQDGEIKYIAHRARDVTDLTAMKAKYSKSLIELEYLTKKIAGM